MKFSEDHLQQVKALQDLQIGKSKTSADKKTESRQNDSKLY